VRKTARVQCAETPMEAGQTAEELIRKLWHIEGIVVLGESQMRRVADE